MIPNYQHRVYLEAFADEVNKLSTDPFELKRVANDLEAWQTRTFGYSSR